MKLVIAQINNNNNTVIAPLTVAEAVLVKKNETVITLLEELDHKIETIVTPAGSGLKALKQNQNVIISHSNIITPNKTPQNVKVQYDSNGHIIEAIPIGNVTITVNNEEYLTTDSSENQLLKLGDDFITDVDKNIKLTWRNI